MLLLEGSIHPMKDIIKTIIIFTVATIFAFKPIGFLAEKTTIISGSNSLLQDLIRVSLMIVALFYLKKKLKSKITYQISFVTSFSLYITTSFRFDFLHRHYSKKF
jgi:hypothetical protein